MSKLDELIKEFCPNGVEYKCIDEICYVKNGYTPSKKVPEYWKNGDVPWFRMEDIRENGKVLTDSIKHVHHSGIKGKLFPANSIIFATTATIGEHALIQVPFMCNQQLTHIHLKEEYTNIINVKYLFYYADLIDDMCKKNTKGGSTLPAVALEKFKMFKIPVPPLEVQCEIVRILDSFTLLTAELTAELTARKKQYEYYRDTLLVNPNTDVTKNVLLSEVAKIKNGKDYKHLSEGVIPVYGSGGIMTYVNQYCYDKPSVLIPRKGSLSNLFYVDEPFWNVDTIFYTEIDEEKVIPKYLYYLLQKQHLEDLNTAGGVPSLTQAVLNKVSLLLPSIDKQLKIVECLDNFDAICSDLNIGLPAEIEARQKQYEFYRDQLLTFAETGRTILTDRQTDRQSLIKLLQYVFGYAPVKLRDIATIVRGGNFQKKDFVENGRPCIHYGQMYTHFGIAADKTLTFVNNEVFSKSKIAKPGDIVMAVTSENVEDVCSCTAWIGAEEIAISGHTAIISHKQNPKFLSYYFHSEMFFMQKKKLAHGTKVIEVTPSKLGDIEILLPNMEEQNRIVSILDRFDSLCNSISEGLPAEIEARQKQYEYYRDKLLNFNQS